MPERENLAGRTLGEFVLRERIGEGGYGAVYRCDQPQLSREAVVKVLHKRLRDDVAILQRFMREAKLASRLDHPYAAHVYAFGIEREDGLFWIAMEMVHGVALNHWLVDHGPLPLDQFVPFFERVAEVVQTAHERGIVHRDLKPSNVMVIERAGRLLPKLLDFGIAKVLDDAVLPELPRTRHLGVEREALSESLILGRPLRPSEGLTRTAPMAPGGGADLRTWPGAAIGSPPYISPEQWSDAATVGPATDLYALGVVAYEALTGRRPFLAGTMPGYAELHCTAPVPPLGDGFAPVLDRWFERALAKRPEQRWASALDLAAALREASGTSGDPPTLPRLDRTVRDAWLAEAPQPLAESIADLDGARNAHQARDAAHDLLRGLLRYLLALAIATRAQVRDDREDPALRELLRTMRLRDLALAERVQLIRLLVRPMASRRDAHPIPELVDLVTPRGDDGDEFEPLLALQPATEYAGSEDAVRAWLARLIPELTHALRRLAFVLDYALVVPRGAAVERWTGVRRLPRALADPCAGERVDGHPVLLDRNKRVCVDLWPVAKAVAPAGGGVPEMFVFDGRARDGARMIAAPTGHEYGDPKIWDWIGVQLLTESDEASEPDKGDVSPYLGLAAYAAGDAARFVGREVDVDALVERMRHRALQLVAGPSGVGKSSLVHAGLVPRLSATWRVVTMRPGGAPLAVLAARLADAGVVDGDLATLLATSPATAATRVAQVANGRPIVLVIDQLEELFTLCTSSEERDRFAAAIAQLAASADLPIRVVATIRDDFMIQLEALVSLSALLRPALVMLRNPQHGDLIRIVVEAARRAGYALSDPDLAHDMVVAVADHPGALALLSFTAQRLWELRDRRFRQLTRSAYDAMGGMAGALVRHAEATLGRLAPGEQRVAGDLFRELVTSNGTRAHRTPQELRRRIANPHADAALDKLIDARLIAISDIEGEPHVEIIHEALLDAWPRLQRWMREDVVGTQMRDQLRSAAQQWNARRRPRGLLWRDDALVDLERWLLRSPRATLGELEATFVAASRRLARRTSWMRRGMVLAAVGLVIALAVTRYRALETDLAEQAARARLTQAYVEKGRDALLEGKSSEALLYLAQAKRRGDDSPMVQFLLARSAQPLQGEVARLISTRGRAWWAAYSPDGRQIATAHDDGAQLWDARSMHPLISLSGGITVYHALFTRDGRRIVTAGNDGAVKIWDARTGALVKTFSSRSPNDGISQYRLALSPDERNVAAIDPAGRIVDIWDLDTSRLLVELIDDKAAKIPSLEFSHDGRWLATASGADLRVYDTSTWKPALVIEGTGVVSLSFDPTGPQLATATSRGDISIWAIPGGTRTLHLRETGDAQAHVAFSPDGAFVVSTGKDGNDRIWNARTGELHAQLANHRGGAAWAEFDPGSRLVVSVDYSGTVAISDVMLRTTVSTLVGSPGRFLSAHFDPSSHRVIAPSWDHAASIWDTRSSYLRWITPPIGEVCGDSVRTEPDGRFLPVGCTEHGTRVWDTAHDKLMIELPSRSRVRGNYMSPVPAVDMAGERAAIAIDDTAMIYGLAGRQVVGNVPHPAAVTSVAFAPYGHELVTGSIDGSLRITSGERDEFLLAALPAAVNVAGFAPGGRVLVADARDKLTLYDVTHRSRLAERDIRGPVAAFRITSDGRHLLALPPSGVPRPVQLWDLERLEKIAQLDAHRGPVFSARFVDGDRQILTAGTDGTARLWDTATGRLRKTFLGTSAYLADAVMDPSGAMVVTAGGDGMVRFWDVASERLIWSLRAHAGRIAGIHFEGADIVTRGFTGELARWSIPMSLGAPSMLERLLPCLALRFDEASGGLVEQVPRCDHDIGGHAVSPRGR